MMNKIFSVLLLALLLAPLSFDTARAQTSTRRDATHWFFGRGAGIRFNGTTPVNLAGGNVNTLDGSAVVSHPVTGALLLYTDGLTVWNGNHQAVQNGTGLFGHQSSGQPALIVPKPGDSTLFYIFTTGAANTSRTETSYSVVDLKAGGGRGAVTQKNVLLITRGTEKIAATRHCNGVDYWVVAHEWGNNRFHSYLITENGIVDTVTTDIGAPLASNAQTQGTTQISPNGRTLATSSNVRKTVELFDFDNATGVLSNVREIGGGGSDYYGLEFSPDNGKLYVNTLPPGSSAAHLFQYDLEAGDVAAIRASRTTLTTLTGGSWQGGQLQVAPDGRIYVSWVGRSFLGVVQQPNLKAPACTYVHDGFQLTAGSSSYGLPNFIDSDVFGVSTESAAVAIELVAARTTIDRGDTTLLSIIVCNGSAAEATNIKLALRLPAGLARTDGGSGNLVFASVPAGRCDTVSIPVRVEQSADDSLTACVDLISFDPAPCQPGGTSCVTLTAVSAPPVVDTGEVDYAFHFLPNCPGTTTIDSLYFNSRRYTDTIIGMAFDGPQAAEFAYGGAFPIHFPIRPTTDQKIPILIRRRTTGNVTSVVRLFTSQGDTFRIRLKTTTTSSVTPLLDVQEVRIGNRTGSFDTCITVNTISVQATKVADTAWFRGGGGHATLTAPTLPFSLQTGGTRTLCFRITAPESGLADTVVLGGLEIIEDCPHCMEHTIIINTLPPLPSTSAVSGEELSDAMLSVGLHPHPVRDRGVIALTVASGRRFSGRLYRVNGERVALLFDDRFEEGKHLVAFDAGNLAVGTYLLRVEDEEGQHVTRTIVIAR